MRLLYLFDLLGTFAFAISGAVAGVRKKFDLYGIIVLALVTAVGGGTIRDVLVGRIPPFIFKDINYFLISIAAALITFFFHKYVEKTYKLLLIMDAIGLGVFTVIGISVGLQYNIGYFGAVVMGVMTGTFGGMIRDVLQKEVPLVLQKEIYASACIIGGIVFVVFDILKINNVLNVAISGVVVFLIRFVAIQKNWHLPKAK
jgi:uncharacterized membrane protein YeiH